MPRVAILGASGRLGKLLVERALLQDYTVTALTRSPKKITVHNERLTVFQGDAQTGAGLEAVLDRCHFCICAIGSGDPILEACTSHLVSSLRTLKRPLERLIFVSRLGAGPTRDQAAQVSGPLERFLPAVRPALYEDLGKAEAIVRSSGLPYVLVRTTKLTDGAPGDKVAVVEATDHPPHRIPRADVAKFVVDLLTQPGWNKREVTIGAE